LATTSFPVLGASALSSDAPLSSDAGSSAPLAASGSPSGPLPEAYDSGVGCAAGFTALVAAESVAAVG